MIFTPTSIPGAYLVDIERRSDDRGWFARAFCAEEFRRQGLAVSFVQMNASFNERAGTLRGLHWQEAPHAEAKLVRCTRGAVHDVIVDVRPDSPTHRSWLGVRLDEASHRAIYVPEGCAHGYLSLADGAEVHYLVTAPHAPAFERGARWDDPAFGVEWPDWKDMTISDRDRSHPPYAPGR